MRNKHVPSVSEESQLGLPRLRLATTSSVILLLLLANSYFLMAINHNTEFTPGRILVQFKQDSRGRIGAEIVDGIAKTNIPAVDNLNYNWQVYKVEKLIRDPNPSELAKQFGMDLLYAFHFPETKDVITVIKDYEKTGLFKYVEPDYIYQADLVPNDPLYSGQWHLPKTQCPLAWDGILGDSTVKVMIIDQGTEYTHDDLKYVYAINTLEDINNNRRFDPYPAAQGGDFDGIDQDQNGYADDVIGYDFYSNDPNPFPNPGDGHGTICAGIALAHTNNNIGVASFGWGARYVDARCGAGGGITASYISALYYAVARGVWAISMSFGGSQYHGIIDNAIQYAWQGGCVLIASAGNEFYPVYPPRYPACYNNVIACAASDQNDYHSNWGGGSQSNYAPWIDCSAPGTSVLTTDNGNTYGAFNGTSMSTPCVAGEALLLKSMYPRMTNAECTTRIFQSCDSMPDPLYAQGLLGRGRINVAKAIYQPIRCNLKTTAFRISDGNDNYPHSGETVALITTIANERGYQNAYGVSATISTNDPDITIIKNNATFPNIDAGSSQNCSADSFVFSVASTIIPHRIRFIINISATPASVRTTDTIFINVGLPRILLVDDDNGADYERWYKEAIDSLRTFYAVWPVATAGSPTLDTLLRYPVVVWFTGLDSLNTLTSTDQNNLTNYLNQGRNLFICGQNIGQNIGTAPFYSNYLHASYVITHTGTLFALGVPGDPLGGVNGDTLVLGGAGGAANASSCDGIRPVGGAYGSFRYRGYADTTVYGAIRYANTYKMVYFGMPFEAINHAPTRYIQKWQIMQRILTFFNEPLPGIEYEQPMTMNIFVKPSLNISPNPFSTNTRINFSLPVKASAQLKIYNVSGELINTITTYDPSISWDGTDQTGKKLIGVYFCELKTSNGSIAKKAVILR